MKKTILSLFLILPEIIVAQSTVISKRLSIGELSNEKAGKPAIIEIIDNSLRFLDESGQNCISAEREYKIIFKIKNTGEGDGRNCKVCINSTGMTEGILFNDITIPLIEAGSTEDVQVPFKTNMSTQNGVVNISIRVKEPHGFDSESFTLKIPTKSFISPLVKVADYSIASKEIIKKKKPFDLQVLLQNVEEGIAEDVNVRLILPDNVLLLEGEQVASVGKLIGGESRCMTYTLIANGNFSGTDIPVTINISEKHGKYARNKTILLDIDQSYEKHELSVIETNPTKRDITLASLSSDVDVDIPTTAISQPNTFAVIISNEHYSHVSNVPYATNDGKIFKEYCHKILGIPSNNIHYVLDATLGELTHQIDWLMQVMAAYKGDAKILFYYAGHGIPDETSKNAYLLPVDGYGNSISSALSLDDFYNSLASLPSKSTILFFDACFSGASREGGMLASTRGVAIKAKQKQPMGNLVVFSAAQGDETALAYNEQYHGMFTYYLLKKIRETEGEVTLGDLEQFLIDQVHKQSIVINGKSQTPSVLVSSSMESVWRNKKLR